MTATHIRNPYRLSAFNAKASKLVRNSTRARCPAWFAAPQTAVDLLTFAPSKQYGPLELPLLRCFCRRTPSKTPSDGFFVKIFSSQDPLAPALRHMSRRIMRTQDHPQKARRAAILCEIFCRPPPDFALAHYARAYYAIPTRRRQRSFIVFSYAFSRVYASVFALICVIFLL